MSLTSNAHLPTDRDEELATRCSAVDAPVDGRMERRYRNMEAVRDAVIELLVEQADLTMPLIARRAGVATRSVYRYFDDLPSAVRDSVLSRLDAVTSRLPDPSEVDAALPLDDRIASICRERVEMSQTIAPVLGHFPDLEREQAVARFDDVAIATFAREIEAVPAWARASVASTIAVTLRTGSVHALSGRHDNDPHETERVLRFMLERLLAPMY